MTMTARKGTKAVSKAVCSQESSLSSIGAVHGTDHLYTARLQRSDDILLASHVLPKSLAPLPIGYLRRLLRSICADQDPLSASQRVASKPLKMGGLSWMGPRVGDASQVEVMSVSQTGGASP
jgi:hypothetical protein